MYDAPSLHPSLPPPLPPSLPPSGEITIQGPSQNETLPSGGTVTLTCSLDGAGQGTEYSWMRESGENLPQDSQISGGNSAHNCST